jgi:hypothetical protein
MNRLLASLAIVAFAVTSVSLAPRREAVAAPAPTSPFVGSYFGTIDIDVLDGGYWTVDVSSKGTVDGTGWGYFGGYGTPGGLWHGTVSGQIDPDGSAVLRVNTTLETYDEVTGTSKTNPGIRSHWNGTVTEDSAGVLHGDGVLGANGPQGTATLTWWPR